MDDFVSGDRLDDIDQSRLETNKLSVEILLVAALVEREKGNIPRNDFLRLNLDGRSRHTGSGFSHDGFLDAPDESVLIRETRHLHPITDLQILTLARPHPYAQLGHLHINQVIQADVSDNPLDPQTVAVQRLGTELADAAPLQLGGIKRGGSRRFLDHQIVHMVELDARDGSFPPSIEPAKLHPHDPHLGIHQTHRIRHARSARKRPETPGIGI